MELKRVHPNLPDTIEGMETRRNVLHQYAVEHDRFGALCMDFRRDGRATESEGARAFAHRLFRAWTAEFNDPTPEGLLPKEDQ